MPSFHNVDKNMLRRGILDAGCIALCRALCVRTRDANSSDRFSYCISRGSEIAWRNNIASAAEMSSLVVTL